MKNIQEYKIFEALKSNPVTVVKKEQAAGYGHIEIFTDYHFGEFCVQHIEKTPESVFNPGGRYNFYKNNIPMDGWNESFGEHNRWIYDLYIAAKDKNEGRPFLNPFDKKDAFKEIKNKFETTTDEFLVKTLTGKLATNKNAILQQLKHAFDNAIKQYQ